MGAGPGARLRAIVVVAVLILPAFAAPTGGETPPLLVQAEDRDRDAGSCASDGEFMQVWEPAEEPGTQILFYPETGCWAEWAVALGAASALSVRYFNAGPDDECAVVELHVDGVPVGATPEACGIRTFIERTIQGTVPAGPHTVRLTSRITSGPGWANLFIDWLQFAEGAQESCPVNRPPTAPGPLSSDGMGAGRFGWARADYAFRTLASAEDPDGDPLSYRWTWGDGGSDLGGPAAGHSYASTGPAVVTLRAFDDPSGRDVPGCPPMTAQSAAAPPFPFRVLQDFRSDLTNPPQGWSCIAGQLVSVTGVGQMVAMECRLGAMVAAEVSSLVARVEFRLDGARFDWDTTTPYDGSYHSLMAPYGHHRLEACATATGDKHGRVFCSDPYAFLNLGAP